MNKFLGLVSAVCLSVVLCVAQDNANTTTQNSGTSSDIGAQTPATQNNPDIATQSTSTNSGAKQTISGCLNQSGGNYTLTDSQSGTVYSLSGDTSQLSPHVGHQVQIIGQSASAGVPNTNPTAAQSENPARQNSFQVSNVQVLADQCSASGSTANGPSASNNSGTRPLREPM